jgi:CelD/BcsL family acetyltransferase involved in cellulose biosynthesis
VSRTAVELLDGVPPLAVEWEALAQRLRAEPFLGPDWIAAHHSAFGTGRLVVIAVRRGERLGAVLPLAVRGNTARSVTNAHTPVFGVLGEDHELICDALAAVEGRGVTRLSLSYLDREGALADAVRRQAGAGRELIVERVMLRSPYIVLDGNMSDYRAQLGKSFRADLRRRNRRLGEQGEVELDIRDGTHELDRLLAEGWRLETSEWKDRIGTAVAAHPATRQFYTEIADRAARRGRLRLYFLRLDGAPISFMFGLEESGVLYLLKGGFDRAHAHISPGQLLLERVIEHAYAANLRRIELLGDDEPHKLVWASTVRERVSLQKFARSPARSVQWAAHAHGRPLALRIGLDRALRPLRDRGRIASGAVRRITNSRARGNH